MIKVAKVTKVLRHQFVDIYATYALSYYFSMFAPYYLLNFFAVKSSLPYTLAFSNTPGLLKHVEFYGKKSQKMQTYILPAGHTGLAFSILSYIDKIKICVTVDEAIMNEPKKLIDLVENNLRKALESTPGLTTEGPESSSAAESPIKNI
jgi:hypothetical protein